MMGDSTGEEWPWPDSLERIAASESSVDPLFQALLEMLCRPRAVDVDGPTRRRLLG